MVVGRQVFDKIRPATSKIILEPILQNRKFQTSNYFQNQDQDTLGGGFQAHQSFSGIVSGLNWFKKKLTTEQVKEIFNNGVGISVPSSLEEHLILDWSEVVKLTVNGAVTLQNEILRQGLSIVLFRSNS